MMSDNVPSVETVFWAKDKFKFETFYVFVDKLIIEIEKRKTAYLGLKEKFSFLTDRKLKNAELKTKARRLLEAYLLDLEDDFVDELMFFQLCGPTSMTKMLKKQIADKLVNTLQNVNIALRIYFAIFGMTCIGEWSFLVLKRVKNCLRSKSWVNII